MNEKVAAALAVIAVIIAAGFTAGYRQKQMEMIDYLVERNKQLEARVTSLREQAELCRIKKGGSR